jgi:hypothetical protein
VHIGIGAAILVLGLIYFAIISPGFRMLLFCTIGIAVAGIAALMFYYAK